MQRVGYLKRLVRIVSSSSSSNLSNLGHSLISNVSKKVRVPLTEGRANYIKHRLTDRAYTDLKNKTNAWLDDWPNVDEVLVSMELQDLYLADDSMPSQTGKLVKNDWKRYTPLGVALGFVRAGTYSANTRAFSLLHLSSPEELQGFLEYNLEINPLLLNLKQSLLLLYSFIEYDGEVVIPLWTDLLKHGIDTFSDRNAGDCLPDIYRQIADRHRRSRMLSADERERLQNLEKSADNIARWTETEGYSGGGAREEHSRSRVEPYADICILTKPDPTRFEYRFTNTGRVLVSQLSEITATDKIDTFLSSSFISSCAAAWNIQSETLDDQNDIVVRLYNASKALRSPGGYAPIRELALLAGIESLIDDGLIFEGGPARQAIIDYQKENPYKVRFTVNRLGVLAHARFLEEP